MAASSDRFAGGIILLLALAILYEALGLEFSTDIGPGPGFLPICLSLLMAALALVLLFKRPKDQPQAESDRASTKRVAGRVFAIFLGIFGFLALMQPLGFLLSGFLFLMYLLAFIESKPILPSLLWAAGASTGFYLIFAVGLNVRLPAGPFGF